MPDCLNIKPALQHPTVLFHMTAVFSSSIWHLLLLCYWHYSFKYCQHLNITKSKIFFVLFYILESLLHFKHSVILYPLGFPPPSPLPISSFCSVCDRMGMNYRHRPGLESCNIGQITSFWTMFSHQCIIIAPLFQGCYKG